MTKEVKNTTEISQNLLKFSSSPKKKFYPSGYMMLCFLLLSSFTSHHPTSTPVVGINLSSPEESARLLHTSVPLWMPSLLSGRLSPQELALYLSSPYSSLTSFYLHLYNVTLDFPSTSILTCKGCRKQKSCTPSFTDAVAYLERVLGSLCGSLLNP